MNDECLDEFLTPEELTKYWRCSRATVDKLTGSGELESVKLGIGKAAPRRIPKRAIEEFTNRHSKGRK